MRDIIPLSLNLPTVARGNAAKLEAGLHDAIMR
jgi:hypothetical protein